MIRDDYEERVKKIVGEEYAEAKVYVDFFIVILKMMH